MTDTEYEVTQAFVLTFAELIYKHTLDFRGFFERIEHADASGPIIDPTMWIKGHKEMHKIRDLARATQTYQTRIKEILDVE